MQTSELIDNQENKIVFFSWKAEKARGQVYIVHGYAEHFRRYDRFARALNDAGYTVHGFDLPGHGLSGGVRGHIDQFDQYLKTLDWFIKNNPNHLNDTPSFLFGHSMGGLIASHYCINQEHHFNGLILSSPLAGFGGLIPLVATGVAKWLSRKDPSQSVAKKLSAEGLTTLKERWPEYTSDPLRLNTISPSLYLGMSRWSQLLHQNAKLLKSPLLTFYSRADSVVSPGKIVKFFHETGSADKQLVAFSDAGHEIIHDHTEGIMIQKCLTWMEQHC